MENKKREPFVAGDAWRKNPLSLTEGGRTVTIHYHDGRIVAYDKVKNPEKYIAAVMAKSPNAVKATFVE